MALKNALCSLRRHISLKSGIILVIIAALALLPLYGSSYIISVGLLVFAYLSLGQMWNLLAGYSGLVSLGQQAFIGIGAYTLAKVTVSYGGGFAMSFVVTLVVAVLFAFIISFPIFKLSGVYFTIGTWIVSESVLVFFRNWKFVNFDAGYNITAAYKIPMGALYLGALALGVISVALVYFILRSKLGLALMAMRDNRAPLK
jgi:branched-chain amino acid transport system permease protein